MSSSPVVFAAPMRGGRKPWGWGDPEAHYPPARRDRVLAFLRERGMEERPAIEYDRMPAVPATRLSREDLAALGGVCRVKDDDATRYGHSVGKSYLDLLGVRLGRVGEITDAVAFPASVEEVRSLVRLATAHGIALVPFGGGTTVLGGVRPLRGPHAGVVTVDLGRLTRIRKTDAASLLAHVEAGISGPALEEGLEAEGLTLGHFPQSFHFSTLGGWIVTRSSGHLSGRYGRIEDMVQAVTVVTPVGDLATRGVPARAVGPDLRELVLGSEGILGILVEAVLRVRPAPAARQRRVLLAPEFPEALGVCRSLLQQGPRPALVRLSDAEEATMILSLAGLEAEDVPSLLLLGFEGAPEDVEEGMSAAVGRCTEAGGVDLGSEAADLWEEEYYQTPYLRDDLMDRGFLVETLETATSWSRLPSLHEAVRTAVRRTLDGQGIPGLLLAHLSHAYRDGGSLYFTLLAPQVEGREVEQWRGLKAAATEAILGAGGTLSHHHGIGVDHLPWLRDELGETGLRALRGLKGAVDPQGIMNPGKLLGEEG